MTNLTGVPVSGLAGLSYMAINTINQICVIVYTLSNISVTEVKDN